MKVVCIKIPPAFVNGEHVIRTEIGKVYDVLLGETGGGNIYAYIKDETGYEIPVDNKYFISLEKYREEQINKLLI